MSRKLLPEYKDKISLINGSVNRIRNTLAEKGYEYEDYEFSYIIDGELYEDWHPDSLNPYLKTAKDNLDKELKEIAKAEKEERRIKRLQAKEKREAKKQLKQDLLAKTLGVE